MRSVAIVGVGLIGGSFGLALRKAGFRGEITGVSSPATIEKAVQAGAIDRGESLEQACVHADLILLAAPIARIIEQLPRVMALARHDAIVTDAGSTKRAICAAAASARGRARFVGGHPMAGKETRGVESAEASLFAGRPWILCGAERDDAVNAMFEWAERAGANPLLMTAEEHDRVIAAASHLPQMVSTALAAALARRPDAAAVAANAGPGLTGMTRLALSGADIWQDIASTNRDEILGCLDALGAELAGLRQRVDAGTIAEPFAAAAGFARKVRER
jgi:prephenate dehydrogenase